MPYTSHNGRGDILVAIKVVTPTNLTDRQEELLREFERAGDESAPTKIKSSRVARLARPWGLD